MKRVILAIAVAGAALVACSESNSPETAQTPTGPSFAPAPPDPCKVAQGFVNNYLSLAADRKAVLDALKAAQGLTAGSAARNAQLFIAFQGIETARDAGRSITTAAGLAAGGNLVVNAIACGNFTVTETHNAVYGSNVLGSSGAWAFVNDGEPFVQTADGEAAALPETGTWAQWIGGPAVVFATEVTANFNENQPGVFQTVFQWGLIKDNTHTYTPSGVDANIELCPSLALPGPNDPTWRVGRQRASGETVLETGDIAGFCETTLRLGQQGSSSLLARAFQTALSLFRPTPLQARIVAPPGVGGSSGSGLLGGFSDYALVIPSGVVVAFTDSIPDGNVNVPIETQVCAATPAPNNTPLEDVAITLTIAGNSGTNVVLSGGGPQDTDETGCTTFNFSINKTGGYTLQATASFTGFNNVTALSPNLFNLQQ